MAHTCLRARVNEKEAEVEKLKEELECLRQENECNRRQLEAATSEQSSSFLVPKDMQAGKLLADSEHMELRNLMRWLSKTINLSQQVVFDCGAGQEMDVGGRAVFMQRMVAWQVGSGDGMKLSVPVEMQAEVGALLAKAQAAGQFAESDLHRFASDWDLVCAEVATAPGISEPALFLVCRKSTQAIVCARWPTVQFAASPAKLPACAAFDAMKHFSKLGAATDTQESRPTARNLSMGDRVEVEYEGEWFAGVIQFVNGNIATIKCDVDEPGVTTDACLECVRLIQPLQAAKERLVEAEVRLAEASAEIRELEQRLQQIQRSREQLDKATEAIALTLKAPAEPDAEALSLQEQLAQAKAEGERPQHAAVKSADPPALRRFSHARAKTFG